MPVSNPVPDTIVAIKVLPVDQAPPPTLLVYVVFWLTQTLDAPLIAPGVVFTVTTLVTKLPPAVYVIVAVPAAIPETVEVVDEAVTTVAIEVLLLLQVPPVNVFVNVVLEPAHTLAVPVIAGNSETAVVPVFHLSLPPPSLLSPFTALMTPRNVTPPKPADGAVHGISLTYCVPDPPEPTRVVAS